MEQQLDGNAAGGLLQEIFPFDMTVAEITCAACGATAAIGALSVYMPGIGTIVRCRSCKNALLRITHIEDRYLLDMRGIRLLQISSQEVMVQG